MVNDTHKDGWTRLSDLAVRIGDRTHWSKDLRNPSAYSPLALASATQELFGEPIDMIGAIERLKLDAQAIAENMTVTDAMALLHEVGMVVNKAAKR